jgi:hypothetical protein
VANFWAASSALTLALFAFLAPQPAFMVPPVGPIEPRALLLWTLGIASLATWAYGIAVAAHGNRGAIVALLANAVAVGAMAIVLLARIGAAFPIVTLLVGSAICAWGCGREATARRGRVQWGAAVAFSLPTIVLAFWSVTRFVQPVTR